ncbi:MAG: SprT family zinc-dependent metalloprotease [Candidatus Endonucleobacter sp. (ex Gigantidas childressi)]|nr:SprT family zinc-dependent metalloprotease [Candidatus Endonucleobacter sp. (ex Gigantidas childressi)]
MCDGIYTYPLNWYKNLYSIECGSQRISFNIQRKKLLKHSYITINSDGVLIKTNNTTSIKDIKDMVKQKSAWINKKLKLFKSISANKNITNGSRLYYMGESYYVNIMNNKTTKIITINFTYTQFDITTPLNYSTKAMNNAIGKFYKQEAINKITPLAEKWAKSMEVEPAHISFRYARKRWGSCSSTNRISFNYQLAKLPLELIEYIVVHELAHITFHNHSKNFWKLVHNYLPDYKIKEEKIRAFEKLL